MSVPVNPNPPKPPATQWNYVDVHIIDGQRVLRPTHIAFDRLIFSESHHLASHQVEIISTNNGQPHSSHARILPHAPAATRIPIQLFNDEKRASTNLTA